MILIDGGVAKSYQSSIAVILEAVSGQVVAFDDLAAEPTNDGSSVLAFSKSEEPWKKFDAYIESAAQAPEVLAFYLPAKLGLAHYLAAGLSPDEAAFAWTTTTKSVLDFARKNRKRVFLANANTVLQFPEKFVEICVNKYRFNGTEKLGDLPAVAEPSDLNGIFSNQIIKQNHEVSKLQHELDARSEPISPYNIPDVFDLKQVFEELNLSSVKYENAATELKHLRMKIAKLSQSNEGLEDENKLLVEQLESVQRDLAESQKSFETNQGLFLEQLAVVQNELIGSQRNSKAESFESQNLALQADLTITKKMHKDIVKKAANISKEYEIIKKEAKLSVLRDELMSEHIESVQSESQQTYNNYLQVSTELEELKKIAKWKEGKTQKLVTELENDLARTHKPIDSLQNSTSWKLTRPVRILSRAIGVARKKNVKTDLERVNASGLFDLDWYLKTYPDLENISMSPIEHFVKYGAYEGRSPGPGFNTRKYTRQNPDVLIDKENPLLHFLESQKGSP